MQRETGSKAKRLLESQGFENETIGKIKRLTEDAWFETQVTLQSYKNRLKPLKLPLQIICLYFVFHYLFQFYDTTPIWARALFLVYVWRNIGQMVSRWH